MASAQQSISTRLVFTVDTASLNNALINAKTMIEQNFSSINIASLTSNLEGAINKLSPILQKVQTDINGLANSFKTSGTAAKQVTTNATTIAPAVQKATVATVALRKEASGAKDMFDSVAGSLLKLGGVFAAVFNGKAIYDINTSLQRSQALFSGLLHSSDRARVFLADMRDYTMQMGFSFENLQHAARGFLQMGMNQNNVMPLLQTMHDIAGNNIQLFTTLGEVINQTASNLGKVERSTLLKLSRAGVNITPEIAKMRGMTTQELESSVRNVSEINISTGEMIQAFHNMTKAGGVFYQNAARQAETLDGRISSLVTTTRTAIATALESISPYIAKIIASLQTIIFVGIEVGKTWWDYVFKPIFSVVVGAARLISYLAYDAETAGAKINQTFMDVASVIGKILTFIGVMFAGLFAKIGIYIQQFIANLNAMVARLSGAQAAVMGLSGANSVLTQNLQKGSLATKLYSNNLLTMIGLNRAAANSALYLAGALKGVGAAIRGVLVSSVIGFAIAALGAGLDRLVSKFTEDGKGLWDTLLGPEIDPFLDLSKQFKNLKQEFNNDFNFTINAPQDKKGRTNLTAEEVQSVLQASRADFSTQLRELMAGSAV